MAAFDLNGGRGTGARRSDRALGARLVKDHTKSLHDALRMAHRFNVAVPKAPTPSERWELQMVGSLNGQAFDQWYARLEVQDHHQDISEAADEVTDGTDKQIRSSAHDEIPTLRTHLHLSEAALKAVS